MKKILTIAILLSVTACVSSPPELTQPSGSTHNVNPHEINYQKLMVDVNS